MNENPYAHSPDAMNGNRRLPPWAMQILIPVAIVAALMFLPRLYFRAKGTSIAKDHEPIVQAICNFRAETGLLPYKLSDLHTRYEVKFPAHVYWSPSGILSVRAGTPQISYVFGDEFEGWSSHWGRLSLTPVTPTVNSVPDAQRVSAALSEYDRRIKHYENDRWHRSAKMALLASLDKQDDVYRECADALKKHPDWWRANFGVATYAPDESQANSEAQFRQWVERTPGFVHYWYLAKYYRNLDRHSDALAALADAANHPLEQMDDDAGRVPHWYAFDAAAYACRQEHPKLALAICEAWANPRGVYDYQSPNTPAFQAAALVQLGRFGEARAAFAKVHAESQQRAIWAGNLQQLSEAINSRDSSYVYYPSVPHEGFLEWSPFPESELQ